MNKSLNIIIDVTLIIQRDEATENFDDELKDTAFGFISPEKYKVLNLLLNDKRVTCF